MTYGELISKATAEQRKEVMARVVKIIGTADQNTCNIKDLAARVNARAKWQKEYERLAKIFLEHGAEALSMNFYQRGRDYEGVTANGKKWTLDMNNGWTERSRYCGTLWIEGEGTVFTSGRLDKVFDYILTH